jgi:oxygen-independent coproporphyrinogen-3 oxidase
MIFTGLYIHIPFCTHRCGYCDFNTYAGIDQLIPAYTSGICDEIRYLSENTSEKLHINTIYLGGGTPSLLSVKELDQILGTIDKHFDVLHSLEISIEANPGTVTKNYLEAIHRLGINRISLGMQSANEDELSLLERQHSLLDVIKSVEWSRDAGFCNLNLDLIFGLPGQSSSAWLTSLDAAIKMHPEHLSLYALTIEHGTPLQHRVGKGLLPEPDPDEAAEMYELAGERLVQAGYHQYEISNWARKLDTGELYSCKHNLQYWRNLPYLGVGAGAHGYIQRFRTINVLTPYAYIQRMAKKDSSMQVSFPKTPATIELNPIDDETEIGETMMMGLRLVLEGVSNNVFQLRFGISLQEKYEAQINRLISLELLEWNNNDKQRLRLTKKGYLLGNQVFKEFL